MRKLSLILVALCLVCSCALADPLVQTDDIAGTWFWPEDAGADAATFVFTYAYPQVAGDSEAAQAINQNYAYDADYALAFDMPSRAEESGADGGVTRVDLRYRVTANDDDWFSVLFIRDTEAGGHHSVSVQAQVFGRETAKAGHIITMPYLLGILDDDEDDDWLRERQTNRADTVIRELVWADIEWRRAQGEAFPDDLTEEVLAECFFPEEEFYYDGETGHVVFFLQPFLNADGMAPDEFYTFSFDFEDILDEM